MAICMIHQNETETTCPCSPYYAMGQALAETLNGQMVKPDEFLSFLLDRGYIDSYPYTHKGTIQRSDFHTLLSLRLEMAGFWDDLYKIVGEFQTDKW
ncbi:hypothetical protein VCHA53O466_50513 [Vibrio chagasii]|nr:hypothetical protein VCHA53O466_50513 [Vibrio chagasii]